MTLPFTSEQFLEVFAAYNRSVYPGQFFLVWLAVASAGLAIKPRKYSNRLITATLLLFWLWAGVVYHLVFFSPVNQAANFFGILFIIQALFFVNAGLIKDDLAFDARRSLHQFIGGALIVYALLIYPLLGLISGHTFPRSPTFGVPCPITIYTFGLLLWTVKKPPLYIFLIPLLWSLIGFSAAFVLGMYEDAGLLIAGFAAFIALARRKQAKKILV